MSATIVSTDVARLDLDRVHAWLTVAYWSEGRTRETVEKAAKDSLNFGAYIDGELVGYARIVTDYTTFGWICDVVVDDQHRGKGVGTALMKEMTEQMKDIKRLLLKTNDAHEFYEQFGFEKDPDNADWMIRRGKTI